jgi:hypothetical protein
MVCTVTKDINQTKMAPYTSSSRLEVRPGISDYTANRWSFQFKVIDEALIYPSLFKKLSEKSSSWVVDQTSKILSVPH